MLNVFGAFFWNFSKRGSRPYIRTMPKMPQVMTDLTQI